MRNLKRALSLAVASVMLLGMMVVGAGAASYPDVSEEDNIEAIEVLQAVKVMIGDENGNFGPEQPVNRSQMAVVMALLLDLDYNYYQSTCPFWDVPSWAEPYVAACYANGIVSGYNATTYGAGDPVTAVQAASMMMRALGYFQYESDYADGFELATVRQASRIQLFDGVGANATDALTRNQVAQLALNALESAIVEADDNTLNITTSTGDATTTVTGGKVNYVVIASDKAFAKAISSVEASSTGLNGVSGTIVELGEQLYNGDLKKTGANDGFGAPATRWSYKNSEIGTYTDVETYMLEGEVKSSEMYAAVGKAAAEDYQWIVKVDGAASADYFTGADVKANNGDKLEGTGRGATTYVYLDNTARGSYAGTATVCVVNTYAAEVIKVSGDKITLSDMDGKRLEAEAAGCAEDDVVLYTKYVDGSSWTVANVIGKAELVQGEAETVRNEKYVVIGGSTYNYSEKFNSDGGEMLTADSADSEVAIYLDRQGNIIYIGEANESVDYAFVLDVGKTSGKYTHDAEFGAQLVTTDGTILNVDLDKDYTTKLLAEDDGKEEIQALDEEVVENEIDADLQALLDKLVGKAVSYNKENDGTYTLSTSAADYSFTFPKAEGEEELEALSEEEEVSRDSAEVTAEDVILNGRSRIDLRGGTSAEEEGDSPNYIYTDNTTVFVINSQYDSSTTFNVYTGYSSVPDVDLTELSVLAAYVNSKGIVKAVFVTNANVKGANDIIFVVGSDNPARNGTGSNRYYVYDAVVQGEAAAIRVLENSTAYTEGVSKLGKGEIGIYYSMTVNADGYVNKLNSAKPSDIEVNPTTEGNVNYVGTQKLTEGVLSFGYTSGDEGSTRSYSYHIAPSNDAVIAYLDGSDLTTGNRLETDTNDKAWVITDNGELAAIFVIKVDDGADEDEELPTLNVDEVDGVIVITSVETLNNNQIVKAIAEYLDVAEDDIAYNSRTKEATVGRTTYGVSFTKVGTEEEVAGAKLAAAIENAVPNPYGTVEVKGNQINVTGGSTYGDPVPGHSATAAVDDLARFLAALHDEAQVEEIVFNDEAYTWDSEQGTRSKWVKATSPQEEGGGNTTLVTAIVTAIADDFANGSCTFTIWADEKPIVFTITTTWESPTPQEGEE